MLSTLQELWAKGRSCGSGPAHIALPQARTLAQQQGGLELVYTKVACEIAWVLSAPFPRPLTDLLLPSPTRVCTLEAGRCQDPDHARIPSLLAGSEEWPQDHM